MLQYGLRALFLLTLAVAIVCGLFFGLPTWLGSLIVTLATLLLPMALSAWAIYGGGNGRALALGGLVGFGVWHLVLGPVKDPTFVDNIGFAWTTGDFGDLLLNIDPQSFLYGFGSAWPFAFCGAMTFAAIRWLNRAKRRGALRV